MSFGGYDAFDDPYCYKGTETLKNKLRLRDAATLESFELEMTTLRAREALPAGKFDPAHYRRVHRHLFQDVYSWAGKYRTVWTSKGGNAFCYPANIASSMDTVFALVQDHRRSLQSWLEEIDRVLCARNQNESQCVRRSGR